MMTTVPLDTTANMPQPSITHPLPSTGETALVIELLSVSEIQPTEETHSNIEPPPLVDTTLTTGTQSSTVVTLSIAPPTQTTETNLIVTQSLTSVTSTIAEASKTVDSSSIVASVQSVRRPRALHQCLLLRQSLLLRPLWHVGSRLHTARRRERVNAQRWHPQRPRRTRANLCAARQHRDLRRQHASQCSRTRAITPLTSLLAHSELSRPPPLRAQP